MLVAVCSIKGSPGATTLAVACAARWPGGSPPLLIEADPAGGDLAARFRLAPDRGLVSWAAAARRGTAQEAVGAVLTAHAQPLLARFPVIVAPPGAGQTIAALSVLASPPASAFTGVANRQVVIADCGRADPESPALPVLRAADLVVIAVRPLPDELSHLAARADLIAGLEGRAGLVLMRGPGYPPGEVADVVGLPVVAAAPNDRHAAAVLGGRATPSRSFSRLPLLRAAEALALELSRMPVRQTLPRGQA